MELPKIFVKYGQNSFWKIGTFLFQYFRKSRENVNDLLKNQNWKLKLKTKMGSQLVAFRASVQLTSYSMYSSRQNENVSYSMYDSKWECTNCLRWETDPVHTAYVSKNKLKNLITR